VREVPSTKGERSFASVPIELIDVDAKGNPRLEIHEWDVEDRMASIKRLGLLTPIIVTPHDEGWSQFSLVSGATRLEACRRLGWDRIDALVDVMSEEVTEDVRLAENLQRAPLTVYEAYVEVCRRRKKYGDNVKRMSDRTGITESQILIFYAIEDKVDPKLIAKLDLDPRPEVMHRLHACSMLEGRNHLERFEAQQKYWVEHTSRKGAAASPPEPEKPKHKRKLRDYVTVSTIETVAKTVVENGRIRAADGKSWIKLDKQTALAVQNAMLWVRDPSGRRWPEEFR